MRFPVIEPICRTPNPAQSIPAVWRVGLALGFVCGVALAPRFWWGFYGGAACILLVLAMLSKVRAWAALKRLLLLEPLVLGIALLALWQPDGPRVFAAMLLKSTLCLSCMIWLAGTTPFTQQLGALRRFRVPGLLITTLALTHRYLFVLMEEMQRMRRARLSRTFTPTRSSLWHSLSTVLAQLFVRSSERAERIYAAMCARGWKP